MAAKGPLAGTPSDPGLEGDFSGQKAKGRSHAGSSIALTCRHSENLEIARLAILGQTAGVVWLSGSCG